MILSSQLNWNDGEIEDSHLDVTDWNFEQIDGKMILFRMAIHIYPAIVVVYRNSEGYYVELEFQGTVSQSTHPNLEAAFDKINDIHTAMNWRWAEKGIGHLRSSVHVPIQWQDENGQKAARTAEYHAIATENSGSLTIFLQGERMFYRSITGQNIEQVCSQLQDMLNQKRFEVGQMAENL